MNVVFRTSWTREEFLLWVEAQEEPYEFDGLRPVRMTRGNNNHARLIRNLLGSLDRLLDRSACEALGPEAGIATVRGAVRYPDVVVTCSPIDGRARLVADPVVVFEVVSPTSVRTDRVLKVAEYAEVASIRRYVIVETESRALTVMWRADGAAGWTEAPLGAEGVLAMPEIGVELPVSEIYDRVVLGGD